MNGKGKEPNYNSFLDKEEAVLVHEMTQNFWQMITIYLTRKQIEKEGKEFVEELIRLWREILGKYWGDVLKRHEEICEQVKHSDEFKTLSSMIKDLDNQNQNQREILLSVSELHEKLDNVLYESEKLIRESLLLDKDDKSF